MDPVLRECITRYADPHDDYVRGHLWRYVRTLEEALGLIDDLAEVQQRHVRILEVGTSGVFPLVLNDLRPATNIAVTHLDPDRPPLGLLTFQRDPAQRLHTCYVANLETEPLLADDGTYDLILLCEVLEHFELDPLAAVIELKRVLRRDGLLLITTPNICGYRSLFKMAHGLSPYFFMKYTTRYGRHNFEYSLRDLRETMAAVGLSEVRLWSEDTFEDPLSEEQIRALEAGLAQMGGETENRGDNLFGIFRNDGPVVQRYPSHLYAFAE